MFSSFYRSLVQARKMATIILHLVYSALHFALGKFIIHITSSSFSDNIPSQYSLMVCYLVILLMVHIVEISFLYSFLFPLLLYGSFLGETRMASFPTFS